MITRDELAAYLDQSLECNKFSDYAPNGLQVQGCTTIQTLVTAVSASQSAIEYAVANNADALMVHHGFFWRGEPMVITGMKQRRIAALLNHNINLFAYHLPLDCHPTYGNNACLAKMLKTHDVNMHAAGGIANVLWSGKLVEPLSADLLSQRLAKIFHRAPVHLIGASMLIESIAWCSGGAQDFIDEASRLGVDAYLSGEVSERTYYQAQELGVHYFACGHHATERYGIQALGDHLATMYGLKHQFFDSENPI